MENPHESPDKLLETEIGMFHLEMPKIKSEAEEIIQISTVAEPVKATFRSALGELASAVLAETQRPGLNYSTDPYDLARGAVIKMINAIDESDQEQQELFQAVKDVIWKGCYSIKGWKWPPETRI